MTTRSFCVISLFLPLSPLAFGEMSHAADPEHSVHSRKWVLPYQIQSKAVHRIWCGLFQLKSG
jgi:hypothetical protein